MKKPRSRISLISARVLFRLGHWVHALGERLEKTSESKDDLQEAEGLSVVNAEDADVDPDHVEGLPEDAPSFKMAGLSERVTGKSMASLRAEAIQLLFALHAGHVIAAEILLSRKIGHIVENNRSIKPGSTEDLRQLNQFITNWTTDAGLLDAAISLLRQIELPDAPLPDVIEPTAEEAELGRELLKRYEQNFNQQVLEQTLGQDD